MPAQWHVTLHTWRNSPPPQVHLTLQQLTVALRQLVLMPGSSQQLHQAECVSEVDKLLSLSRNFAPCIKLKCLFSSSSEPATELCSETVQSNPYTYIICLRHTLILSSFALTSYLVSYCHFLNEMWYRWFEI
jgi:hypothetical protein